MRRRRPRAVLLTVLILACACPVLIVLSALQRTNDVDRQAVAIGRTAIGEIMSNWDPTATSRLLSPFAQAETRLRPLEGTLSTYNRDFGKLIQIESVALQQVTTEEHASYGTHRYAYLGARVRCERADVKVELILVRLKGKWMVDWFEVRKAE